MGPSRRVTFLSIILLICLIIFFGLITTQPQTSNLKLLLNPQNEKNNIYAHTGAGMLSEEARKAVPRVYVPNSIDNTVSVIDPTTYKVIDTFKTDKTPQHIVPSYDLKTLWVLNNSGNTVIPIDPTTGKPSAPITVDDPYNLYFTPDGRYAIVVDEARKELDFRDPKTMQLIAVVPVQCGGVNHMDFTTDGRYALATCEYSGELLKLDVANKKIVAYLTLGLPNVNKHGMPQDIRLAPDGKLFYVADMMMDGVFLIDPVRFTQVGFIATGIGTHSIYPSRDGRFLYVANRGCRTMVGFCAKKGPGNVTVIDPSTQKIVAIWPLPEGGSPDMGNVSIDGKELWLSGRYDSEVYVFDTEKGLLKHRIPVGRGPHGLTVWPQPGRFSLGHTGNMR